MKRRYIIFGAFAISPFMGKAQKVQDSIVQVDQTHIELVYNHYLQDGNNSAITGGIGTEKLTVYGPSATVKKYKDNHSYQINTGVDIISSASTDNIDFIPSSASAVDSRAYLKFNYGRTLEQQDLELAGGGGLSIESDYFSISSNLSITKDYPKLGRVLGAQFDFYHDDLRWGRLDKDVWKPQYLIYPEELRDSAWHDTYKRLSSNIRLSWEQVLNAKNVIGIYPEVAIQSGLLSTPFHRVYFNDGTLGVEQLPDKRYKIALGGSYKAKGENLPI